MAYLDVRSDWSEAKAAFRPPDLEYYVLLKGYAIASRLQAAIAAMSYWLATANA
jgi:hypothetical protein